MRVSIVGATGAVGQCVVECLKELDVDVESLELFASARSAGKNVETPFGPKVVRVYDLEAVRNESDVVFLAVSGSFALSEAPKLCANDGPLVVDNSSAFRYNDEIPLVIPEINGHLLDDKKAKLVANPNCASRTPRARTSFHSRAPHRHDCGRCDGAMANSS